MRRIVRGPYCPFRTCLRVASVLAIASFYYRDPRAPSPNRPRKLAVTALVEHDGKVLLERRADARVWGLIAGGVEDDETLEQALRREIREETGLEISTYDFFGTFSDPSRIAHYPDGNIMQVLSLVYRASVDNGSGLRTSEESTDLRFFLTHELPPDLVASHRPIIERYLSSEIPPFLE